MRKIRKIKPLEEIEDHRARICLDYILEFLRLNDGAVYDYSLKDFQQRIWSKIKFSQQAEDRKERERKKGNYL